VTFVTADRCRFEGCLHSIVRIKKAESSACQPDLAVLESSAHKTRSLSRWTSAEYQPHPHSFATRESASKLALNALIHQVPLPTLAVAVLTPLLLFIPQDNHPRFNVQSLLYSNYQSCGTDGQLADPVLDKARKRREIYRFWQPASERIGRVRARRLRRR
jgi:hypothetical protein